MSVWMMSHDCPFCHSSHALCLDEYPDDDAVYAYKCPSTGKPVRFKFGEMAFRLLDECEDGSLEVFRIEE